MESEGSIRKKPRFLRKDWHKKIKLGSKSKKKRKWKKAIGIHNKIRLGRKGHSKRPKIGWSAPKKTKGMVRGYLVTRVENMKALDSLKKSDAILIGKVGKKLRSEILAKAKEKDLVILNKYPSKENAVKN